MKRISKNIVALLLLGAICLGSASCAVDGVKEPEDTTIAEETEKETETEAVEDTTEEVTEAETEEDEADADLVTVRMPRFDITYFYGPHNDQMVDEYFYQMIAEAGFTAIPLEYGNTELNKQALPLLRKYGLVCCELSDSRIRALIDADPSTYDIPQEEVDRIIAEVVADYAEHLDIVEGWGLKDEPNLEKFKILAKIVKAFKKLTPDKSTMINLFPIYAWGMLGTDTYQEYLDEFVKQVEPHYLSYDHYHFFADGTTRNDFFTNLEMVRDKAKESDIDPMIIVLLTKHMNYADVTYDQIEWEVNTSLTYGMKRISYFTFILEQYLLDDGWTNACMSYTGEVWPHYYDVQAINKWLLPLGTELFDKESVAVFHLKDRQKSDLEPECEEYTPYGDLGAVNGNNFVIGFFDDGSFMITNKIWRENDGKYNSFVFKDIDSGLEYFDTESATWRDAEADGIVTRNSYGKLSRKFNVAEGILFRVSK